VDSHSEGVPQVTRICRTRADLALAFAAGTALIAAGKAVSVTVREHTKRTLDQNALLHLWMEQAALEIPEHDALGWKCYVKLHHGVPILRAEDEEFRAFYDAALKPRTYEQKLEAMKFVPVTSLMKVPQMTRFMDAVQADFANHGVILEAA
jgi:hypothetical protein